ncbi:hypothetical protein KW787_03255 [Candidatus Pacearchaeota archaeon]|nr:hypothetical protein [Candidatus Pacearchaeota archaeon]
MTRAQENITAKIDVNPRHMVRAGENAMFQITLLSQNDSKRKDVQVIYTIKDKSGKTITYGEETVALEQKASFVAKLYIPTNLESDIYTVVVQVRSVNGDQIISSSSEQIFIDTNSIMDMKMKKPSPVILLIMAIIILLAMIYLISILRKNARSRI